jgi:hypothetical protein
MAANNPTAWTPNTTCDILHFSGVKVNNVPCYLVANYERHEESGEGDDNATRYTHTMLVAQTTDIRDEYDTGVQAGNEDTVYIPSSGGAGTTTPFAVRFVETKGWGTGWVHLKVYLDRGIPPWPTKNL